MSRSDLDGDSSLPSLPSLASLVLDDLDDLDDLDLLGLRRGAFSEAKARPGM
jgi:hypothetical protein